MAIKQFAIPLNDSSSKPGEANFEKLIGVGASADFEITNVSESPVLNELNLITKKKEETKDHKFTPSFKNGSAIVTLSASDLSNVYDDGEDGDWDYVEAKWTVNQIDTPPKSNLYIYQSGRTYNYYGW